jgi:hypothetical protein
MAQAVSRRPVTAAAWVRAQVNSVGFVVDKVALGQVFLRVLRLSPVNIIPPWAPQFRKLKKNGLFIHPFTHPHPRTDKKARNGGRSSVRRQFHTHNQNNTLEYTAHLKLVHIMDSLEEEVGGEIEFLWRDRK